MFCNALPVISTPEMWPPPYSDHSPPEVRTPYYLGHLLGVARLRAYCIHSFRPEEVGRGICQVSTFALT